MTNRADPRWLPIAGTDGLYDVSDAGQVRRTIPLRVLKSSDDGKGYARVSLSVLGVVTLRYVAHLVLEAFDRGRQPGEEARHLDGNPANNARGNLAWGTKADNMQDALRHGTFPVLELRPGAKLTRANAVAIFTSSEPTSVLAHRYGVGGGVIRQVKTRETWASVTRDLPDAAWNAKPKHAPHIVKLATDPTKTRFQAAQETGLTIHQIKRLRKLARLKPTGRG